MTDLYWYCGGCGDSEQTEAPYVHGDHEPCECGGTARVVTVSEAAQVARAFIYKGDAVGLLKRFAEAPHA